MPKQARRTSREALPWRVILSSRNVWALTVSYFAFGYVSYIFFTWFFIYLNTVRGLDLKASAFFGMLPFLAMATFSPLGGYISDRLTKRYGKRMGRCGIPVASMAVAAGFIALCDAGAGCPRGQHRAGGRRRRTVSLDELLLVRHRRHRRPFRGIGFRRNEHGEPDRRHGDGFPDARAGQRLRLALVLSGGGRPLPGGVAGVAVGGPQPGTVPESAEDAIETAQ